MITLNPDQQKAKEFFQRWWRSSYRFAILEGMAGTGKTTIVQQLVEDLPDCSVMFTAATNEACRQLENVLPKGSMIKTTYSALNFHFDESGEVKELKQNRVADNQDLGKVNLVIVDECSFIGQTLLDALLDIDKKVLFIGHRSQLPEVNTKMGTYDLCESIVFQQSYPIYNLTTPERNKGELFDFLVTLDNIIYNQPRIFKSTYSKGMSHLLLYIDSKEGKAELLSEDTKIICWSNKEADKLNSLARHSIFNQKHLPAFVVKDRILLTEPVQYIGELDKASENAIAKLNGSDSNVMFSANSKAIVRRVNQVSVLGIPCWELNVECDGLRPMFYVPIDYNQFLLLRKSLLYKCYGASTSSAKEKAFRRFHFIMSLFAKVKHSYAITVHRSQGMTIPNVKVAWYDIKRGSNIVYKHKLLYVAASRARDNLTIIT